MTTGQCNSLNTSAGTSSNILTGNGASSQPTFQAPSGLGLGAFNYITTVTASAVANAAFTSIISNTYNSYRIYANGVLPATNATSFTLNFSDNNGSSYDTTSTSYAYYYQEVYSNAANAASGSSSAAGIIFGPTFSSTASNSNSFVFDIINPASAYVYCQWNGYLYTTVNGAPSYATGAGRYLVNSAVNAWQFIMSSGNITGTFQVYGFNS